MRLTHLATHSTKCRPRHWSTQLQAGANTEALGDNPCDVQDELLLDIVADSLAEAKAKAKTLCHTVVDVKAVTLNERVTDTQVEAEACKLGDILTAVKDKALVDTLADMLTETEAAILCHTLVDVEERHWFKTWMNWKKRLTLGVTLNDQKANGLVDTLPSSAES